MEAIDAGSTDFLGQILVQSKDAISRLVPLQLLLNPLQRVLARLESKAALCSRDRRGLFGGNQAREL